MKHLMVCKNCTGIEPQELKNAVEQIDCEITIGCIKKCASRYPELKGKAYGLINDEFTICESKEELLLKIEEAEDVLL